MINDLPPKRASNVKVEPMGYSVAGIREGVKKIKDAYQQYKATKKVEKMLMDNYKTKKNR
jgi:hypothetical protein